MGRSASAVCISRPCVPDRLWHALVTDSLHTSAAAGVLTREREWQQQDQMSLLLIGLTQRSTERVFPRLTCPVRRTRRRTHVNMPCSLIGSMVFAAKFVVRRRKIRRAPKSQKLEGSFSLSSYRVCHMNMRWIQPSSLWNYIDTQSVVWTRNGV